MAENVHDIPAATKRDLLRAMLDSPAFVLFCDRWDETVENDVDKKIFDPATSDTDTRELKRVRVQLTGTRHPKAIVDAMVKGLANHK